MAKVKSLNVKTEDVLDRVKRIEEERSDYYADAELWEEMWRLKWSDKVGKRSIIEDGVEKITTPTPYNVVQLGTRLVASAPRIKVPMAAGSDEDEDARELREQFLTAFWEMTDRQQRTDVVSNAGWQSLVRGRHVFEVKWIKDLLPSKLQDKRLPILVRTLDPFNAGTCTGPYYTEYAYHKFETTKLVVKQWFPDMKWVNRDNRKKWQRDEEDETAEIIDYWWVEDEGDIGHAIIVNGDQFGLKPRIADYYTEVPIVEGYADSAPVEDETYKGLSILHPLKEIWPLECRDTSYLASGMLYYFNPIIVGHGQNTKDLELGPGAEVMGLDEEDKIEFAQPQVNMPLAQGILQKIDQMIQTSTFPSVMYGQNPGQVSAGYAINTLAQHAESRASRIRQNLESSIEIVNQIILGLVENAGKDEGVTVWGIDKGSGTDFSATLTAKEINGNYNNRVTLVPDSGQSEAQMMTIGMQANAQRLISGDTTRDKFVQRDLPKDERDRIAVENLFNGELKNQYEIMALKNIYPDTWHEYVVGTPYEQLAQQMEDAKNRGEQPAAQLQPGQLPNIQQEILPQPVPQAPQGGIQQPDMAGPGTPSNVLPPQETGMMPDALAGILNDPSIDPQVKALIQQDPMTAMETLRSMGLLPPEGMG